MAEPDPRLDAHIAAVAARGRAETLRLAASMLGRCWPGSFGDRTGQAEMRWLRVWGPQRASAPLLPACECAGGRCQVCN